MIEFKKFTLKNGLRIIHHFDNSTPLVCLNILYNIGARDEDPDKTGFAHLFEHLMFGGSVNIPNYDEFLQKAGGENNAFTNNDITNYYLTIPAENIETGFWLESDRMLSLAFSEKSLEVQRSVVIEEFRQRYLNQPYGDAWLILRPLAYKVHPYQWATIGKQIDHIEHATMKDVREFFSKFYLPNNAIMVIAGNIEYERSRELSEKWFEPIPSGKPYLRNLPSEPEQTEPRELVVKRDVPVNMIYKVFHVCERNHEDFHSIDLLSDIIGRGKSSRFYKELVKDKKYFSELDASITGDLEKGLFVISGKIAPGIETEIANQAINSLLSEFQGSIVPEKEVEKVINKTESTLVFSAMNILNKAMNLAFAEIQGDANLINKEIDLYRMVTPKRIQEVANKYLSESNSSTLYYLTNN